MTSVAFLFQLSRGAGAVVISHNRPRRGAVPSTECAMIAAANSQATAPSNELVVQPMSASSQKSPAWHRRFLHLLADICRNARIALRTLPRYRREEAIDEVVAFAFVTYGRLVELGKENLAYATPIARYAIAQYRAGRRVGVRANVRDVFSHNCRR